MSRPVLWWQALGLVVVVVTAWPVGGAAQPADGDHDQATSTGPSVPYEVTLTGVADEGLRGALLEASLLRALAEDPPVSVLSLRRRVAEDASRLRKVLESEGYYAATIRHEVDTGQAPAQVTLSVDTGPRYTLDALSVDYADAALEERADLPQTLPDLAPEEPRLAEAWQAKTGAPARADVVLDAIDQVQRLLRQRGYPDAVVSGHKATVNHGERTMTVTVNVDAGEPAVFGATIVQGNNDVEADYVRRHQPWQAGDLYDVREVEEFRRRLLASGLFASVVVEPVDKAGGTDRAEGGSLPMKVTVEESDHRSIGVGARYSTSIGPTLSAFWEHRNLFGEDEDFRIEGEVSPVAQSLAADFAKPHFLRWDQTLTLGSELSSERFEAYDRTALETAAGINRRLNENLSVGAGITADYARISSLNDDRRSTLFGLPLTLNRDDADDLLDPRSGSRLALAMTPYTGTFDGPVTFAKLRGDLSSYVDLSDDGDSVLASRIGLGTMLGIGRSGVPPDKRFYAGGGGSIRGFGYQMAGTLGDGNDPVGGSSLIEASLELRQKVTDSIGIVPFIDVGRAYDEALPNLGEDDLFLAFGLGGRYYSAIGPVRLDVAFPVRPRRNIDDRYQIYVSLGQAF